MKIKYKFRGDNMDKIIYKKVKMIHGDLGEFNIVLDHKGNILLIDWLQWVSVDHPNAASLLERDITNICKRISTLS